VPPGGLDRARGVEDGRREHVDAHEREVGVRLLGLLDQARDAPVLELGHSVVLGIGHRRQQDQRLGLLASEGGDEVDDAVSQEVVPQVHHEGRVAEEGLGGQDGVGEAERLVLLYVLDGDAEARAVPGGGANFRARLRSDDDSDVLDARLGHRLEPVEQDRLVGHGDQLLRARVREGAQARALTPGEDQPFQPVSSAGIHARALMKSFDITSQ
jgi:hypothetical protein